MFHIVKPQKGEGVSPHVEILVINFLTPTPTITIKYQKSTIRYPEPV